MMNKFGILGLGLAAVFASTAASAATVNLNQKPHAAVQVVNLNYQSSSPSASANFTGTLTAGQIGIFSFTLSPTGASKDVVTVQGQTSPNATPLNVTYEIFHASMSGSTVVLGAAVTPYAEFDNTHAAVSPTLIVAGPSGTSADYALASGFYALKVTASDAGVYSGSIVSSAPEPAAWSLMILGVGGMGAALRTRRRKAVAA